MRATSGELYETIARADAAVSDAFNAHDIERLMAMFTDDLEFYGDGLNDYAKTKADFVKLFAGTPDIRRELRKETLEIYPRGRVWLRIGAFRDSEIGGDHAIQADCPIQRLTLYRSRVW